MFLMLYKIDLSVSASGTSSSNIFAAAAMSLGTGAAGQHSLSITVFPHVLAVLHSGKLAAIA